MNVDELFNLIISKVKFGETIDPDKLKEAIDLNQSLLDNENGSDFNIQKRKFQNLLTLSKLATITKEWFNSSEGTDWMIKNQIKWTNENIGKDIFGYSKSSFNKLLKVGAISDFTIKLFFEYCENRKDLNVKYTIEKLIWFARWFRRINEKTNILEFELNRFKRFITMERKRFLLNESVQLADEFISRIESAISKTSNIEIIDLDTKNIDYEEDSFKSEARKFRLLRNDILKEFPSNK